MISFCVITNIKKVFTKNRVLYINEYFLGISYEYISAETSTCSIPPALSNLAVYLSSSSSLLLSLITFVAKKATTYIDTNPVTE